MSTQHIQEESFQPTTINPITLYDSIFATKAKKEALVRCISHVSENRMQDFSKEFNASFDIQQIYDILLYSIENLSEIESKKILQYIVETNITFNEPGDAHSSLVIKAINKNQRGLAILMIKQIPNIKEIKDLMGNCPIHHAVANQDMKMIEVLISHKANLNSPNSAGLSPLCIAIESKNHIIAKYLIRNGAKVNSTHDNSPLLTACALKDGEKFVAMLLECGVIIDQKNSQNKDCFSIARQNDNYKSLKILQNFKKIAFICATDSSTNFQKLSTAMVDIKNLTDKAILNGKINIGKHGPLTPLMIATIRNAPLAINILKQQAELEK